VTIQLRRYQLEALEAWRRSGAYGMVVLPTGTGKTWIGLEAIRRELERGGWAAVIVPTITLAHQWADRVRRHLRVRPALFYGEEKDIAPVTVFVVNSAYLNRDLLDRFSLVVIDEAHHMAAPKWGEILPLLDGKRVLGLTATPERAPLPVVYYMSVPRARAEGAVAPVRIVPVFVPLAPDERARYLEVEEALRKAALALESARRRRDRWAVRELEERVHKLANLRKRLVSLARAKFAALAGVALRHRGEKVLVFTESIESAELAVRVLRRAGVPARAYHSQLSPQERRALLQLWGRGFGVLVAVRCLDEGIDVPECGVGAIVASGKSTRQLVQRLGRIIRPHPGKREAVMYVIAAAGTYEHEVVSKLARIAYLGE
jgi:superfamily II DNA or RNA helicase